MFMMHFVLTNNVKELSNFFKRKEIHVDKNYEHNGYEY